MNIHQRTGARGMAWIRVGQRTKVAGDRMFEMAAKQPQDPFSRNGGNIDRHSKRLPKARLRRPRDTVFGRRMTAEDEDELKQ